jgi:hypothetical protein
MFQFTKYLAFKAVQVVVQSRLGDKCQAPSCPDTTKANISPWIQTEFQCFSVHMFWASRIRIHQSEVWIWIRILLLIRILPSSFYHQAKMLLTKLAGFGSRSISQRHEYPDPYKNVIDPQHCCTVMAVVAVVETELCGSESELYRTFKSGIVSNTGKV